MNNKLVPIFILVIILLLGFVIFNNQKTSDQKASTNSESITSESTNQVATKIDSASDCSGQPIIELTEGPYYTANTPQSSNFYTQGTQGTKLTLTGFVFDTNCQPIKGAWLDFWQADGEGVYDNSGYKFRGHQFTDENGQYSLVTVIPGEYPGRTPHIHVKVRANSNSPVITSQLFIPGAAQNNSDSIYNESLLITNVLDTADGKTANFNLVVKNN